MAADCESGLRGLRKFIPFAELSAFAAAPEIVDSIAAERRDLWPNGRPPGDGTIIAGMTSAIAEALHRAGMQMEGGDSLLHEHSDWVWNVYSGLAHGFTWPRLLPGIETSRGLPGDFSLDLHQTASAAEMAIIAALSRMQPGTAGTTDAAPGEWPIATASSE